MSFWVTYIWYLRGKQQPSNEMMDFCALLPPSPHRVLNDGVLGDDINLGNYSKAGLLHEFLHRLCCNSRQINHSYAPTFLSVANGNGFLIYLLVSALVILLNTATRVVLLKLDNSTPVLKTLQWLPTSYQVKAKPLMKAHKITHDLAPCLTLLLLLFSLIPLLQPYWVSCYFLDLADILLP